MNHSKLLISLMLFSAALSGCKEEISPEELAGCVTGEVQVFDADQVILATKALYRKSKETVARAEEIQGLQEAAGEAEALADPEIDAESINHMEDPAWAAFVTKAQQEEDYALKHPQEAAEAQMNHTRWIAARSLGASTPAPAPSASPIPVMDPFAGADLDELAKGLAFQAAVLTPEPFNDTLAHFLIDYRKSPEDRAAIELLIAKTRAATGCQLREQREDHPVITVIDDVLIVFSLYEGAGLAKGIWKSRGTGLKGIKRFKKISKTIFSHLIPSKKKALALVGIGTAAGTAHAIFNHLQTKKMDPAESLLAVQGAIVIDLGTKVAAFRDELRLVKPEEIRGDEAKVKALRERLNAIEPELRKLQKETEHLFSVAQPLRSKMQPVADDISETRGLISRLGMQVDAGEMGDALKDDAALP